MNRLWLVVLVAGLGVMLTGCGAEEGPTPTPTRTPAAEVELATATAEATDTPVVVSTDTPTPEAVSSQEPADSEMFWKEVDGVVDDNDQIQDQAGVLVHVKGMGLMDWAAARANVPDMAALAEFEMFQDLTSLGVATVIVTNTKDVKVNIHPDQGTIVVGNEQVDLSRYMFFSDDVGGEIFPGVVKEGNVIFGLKRTPWESIAGGVHAVFEIRQPSGEDFMSLTDAPYQFEFQLTPKE